MKELKLTNHELNIVLDGLMYIIENSETGAYKTEASLLSDKIRNNIIGGKNEECY